jgi:hypothetical protein
MKLIEILTTPYTMSCDCAACFAGNYQKMAKSIQGCYESEAISVLADQQLSNLLKMGKANVDRHALARFGILMSLVSDPKRKLTFIKNLVKDDAFDLELLDLFTIREYGRTDNTQREIMDSSLWFQIEKIIKNAYVFRRFPELIENKILPYDTEKLIVYITEIDELGAHHFQMYFSHYYKDDLVVITHMLFDEYLKTNQDFLVRLIQIVYSMLDNAKTPRFRIHHAHSVTELTNKILSKCKHEYLPFKTTNFGAQNLDEYMYLLEKNNFVKQNLLDLSSQQNQKTYLIYSTIDGHRKHIQMIEHKIQLLNKQLEHNTQSESRITHLYQLRNLNPLERLQFIIDSEYSIHYYPPFLLEDSFEFIDQLSPKSKEKLLNKLKTAKRGTMKKLKLSLSSK